MPQPPAAWDDPFVPIRPIADTTGRPAKTIYRWARLGVIRSMRAPDGRLLVAMDDYLVASETRAWRDGQHLLDKRTNTLDPDAQTKRSAPKNVPPDPLPGGPLHVRRQPHG